MFDPSPSYKQYVNRSGRTGRAEKMGACINLLYNQESLYVDVLNQDTKAEQIEKEEIDKTILYY
jgi:superfamily II DNA/RNA helicase